MLDLNPDRRGLIPAAYALCYKELGDFIRSCCGNPIRLKEYLISDNSSVHIIFDSTSFTADRSVIRSYTVDVQLVNATTTSSWVTVAEGTGIGDKKIDLWEMGPQLINAVRLTITKPVDTPVIKFFTVYLCH